MLNITSVTNLIHLRWFKWILHPVSVFIFLQIFLISLIVMWILWYLESNEEFSKLAPYLDPKVLENDFYLIMLVLGIVFLGIILIGTSLLFVTLIREKRMNKQQSNFLSSVSHELRSPLASMQLSLDTLKTRELSKDMHDRLIDMIGNDRVRLARLVEQILLSSKLDIGRLQLEQFDSVNIHDFIREISSEYTYLDQNLFNRLEIQCDKTLEATLPRIAFKFIVGNLLENAIKYSDRNSPIVINIAVIKGFLVVKVKDSGMGIEKKEQKKVFKMFQRADSAISQAISGTGLGLFIVKSITKSLGGRINLQSEGHNKGTEFIVTLPSQ